MVGLVMNQSSFLNMLNTYIMYIRKLLISFKMEDEHKNYLFYFITAIRPILNFLNTFNGHSIIFFFFKMLHIIVKSEILFLFKSIIAINFNNELQKQ